MPDPNRNPPLLPQQATCSFPYLPGSPIFTPEGTYIFQKLQAFLRAQYPAFGFQEVLTPTIYKQSLWEQSGHWENYKNDMFIVGSSKDKKEIPSSQLENSRMQPVKPEKDSDSETISGLKPMNCPAHCILFASKTRSYQDLPIRYADFSPLHRDEVSGALSGLTRVRCFHQDDGHIFCRPTQIKDEIAKSIQFMETVYRVLGVPNYHLLISTRPEKGFIGTREEWERAEKQLEEGLQQGTARSFNYSKGDGAFYGPKIDAIIWDGGGRKHQIGTIQLDFQLPKRFNLSYVAPRPESETGEVFRKFDRRIRKGLVAPPRPESETGEVVRKFDRGTRKGPVAPVMIHRAILGSLERFMAVLIEINKGKWPFWLNPNPVVVLTVTDNPLVQDYAKGIVKQLNNPQLENNLPRPLNSPYYKIDLNDRDMTVARKIALANEKGYAIIVVVGEKNVKHQYIDVTVSNILNQRRVWDTIEKVKPGSQAPVQKDRGVGTAIRGNPGVKLTLKQLQNAMQMMTDQYI
ncbi:MAG: hypothetical protein Q9217_000153 [Psora testacea]